MNVVLNFHKGDQHSAEKLLYLLMVVNEGTDAEYFLQYGDHIATLEIGDTILDFCSKKNANFSNEKSEITVPSALIDNDPNLDQYPGVHTRRSKLEKYRHLQWNLCVFKYINLLDSFLMIEPDTVILKENWLADISRGYQETDSPIYGHLKKGLVNGNYVATHWAGCSVYNCVMLRQLDLERFFFERYQNPWWALRESKNTECANNCFIGPVISGYDVSYDYFLFARYWEEKTGNANPLEWDVSNKYDSSNVIRCDFRSSLTADEVIDQYYGKVSLYHGAKGDEVRDQAIRLFSQTVPLHTVPYRSIKFTRLRNCPVSLRELKNKFSGERCFIIGNGPSLRVTDLSKLKDEYTFGLNRIYLNYESMGFEPTFYCAVNPYVIEQFAGEIDKVGSIKFVREGAEDYFQNTMNTFFVRSNLEAKFNTNFEDCSWFEGWTVTFCAMQVAYYMGFSEVVLVGVDHNFSKKGEPNKVVTSAGDDENHFSEKYFSEGVKWQYPDLKKSEKWYLEAERYFRVDGRQIVDATIGGHLDVFEKVNFDDITAEHADAVMSRRGSGSVLRRLKNIYRRRAHRLFQK